MIDPKSLAKLKAFGWIKSSLFTRFGRKTPQFPAAIVCFSPAHKKNTFQTRGNKVLFYFIFHTEVILVSPGQVDGHRLVTPPVHHCRNTDASQLPSWRLHFETSMNIANGILCDGEPWQSPPTLLLRMCLILYGEHMHDYHLICSTFWIDPGFTYFHTRSSGCRLSYSSEFSNTAD